LTLYEAVSQLFSYSPLSWIAFVSIATGAACLGRWWGLIAGQVIVAMLVGYLDVVYQSQHTAEMDTDFLFGLGMMVRMLLINTVLLPISAFTLFAAIRRRKHVQASRTVPDETTWPPAPTA